MTCPGDVYKRQAKICLTVIDPAAGGKLALEGPRCAAEAIFFLRGMVMFIYGLNFFSCGGIYPGHGA